MQVTFSFNNNNYLHFWNRAHDCEEFQLFATERKVRLVFIPEGCTSIEQPLDVSVNKPFKDSLRKLWSDVCIRQNLVFFFEANVCYFQFMIGEVEKK
jgi:hypothetical protein